MRRQTKSTRFALLGAALINLNPLCMQSFSCSGETEAVNLGPRLVARLRRGVSIYAATRLVRLGELDRRLAVSALIDVILQPRGGLAEVVGDVH
jgi:hypothetical protein